MDIIIVAHLYAYKNDVSALRAFEAKVLPILGDHEGELRCAFGPAAEMSNCNQLPDEIHILRFPSKGAFDSYKSDPRHTALAEERKRAISRTEIFGSDQTLSYT